VREVVAVAPSWEHDLRNTSSVATVSGTAWEHLEYGHAWTHPRASEKELAPPWLTEQMTCPLRRIE
jgi:hypothetical protein